MQLPSTIIILLSFSPIVTKSNAAYMVLTNPMPKCVVVNAAKGSSFAVDYDSLDIKAPNEHDILQQMQQQKQIPKRIPMRDHDAAEVLKANRENNGMMGMMDMRGADAGDRGRKDGRDEMWQKRQMEMMQRNVDVMKRKSDVYIGINEFHEKNKEKENVMTHATSKQTLNQKKGSIHHSMVQHDAAKICVSSNGASTNKPTFISIRIRETFPEKEQEAIPKNEKQSAQSEKDYKHIHSHMKYLERELFMMIQHADRIIDESRVIKLTHSRFHDAIVDLSKTLKWISIVQICIILLTASLYSRSVISHLKKLKIIY